MKRKLITSALPYVNNIPHLGNLIQVLSADVFARFCRSREYETLYICGTDEYGTATETRAQEEGKTPRELCDYYHAIHADIYRWFGIEFDSFGRTSTPEQTEIVQSLFKDLDENAYISEHTIHQLYCTSCNRFLADRYVRGSCPHCASTDARGDQCESCGKLLEPTELTDPRCSTCNSTPVLRSTKHLYIDLPKILPKYEAWMKEASVRGEWAKNAIQMTQAWIRDGLHERAITRDLKWGIPVPKEGFEDKVFYVWFDAPIGYISIAKALGDAKGFDWRLWWQNPENVELFQFIGKDNIPFHTVIFPSSLIGSGKNWTKLHHISSSEYLNYETGKFSKSKGIGVFGNDAKESGLPADAWRFYVFYNRPEKSDTLFTWKDFQEKLNGELIGNLGNLVNRALTFVSRYYDGIIPEAHPDEELWKRVRAKEARITELLEGASLRDAFHEIFTLSSIANKAFQEGEPWKTRTTEPEKAAHLLRDLCYIIKDLAILIQPFLPQYAEKVAGFFAKKLAGSVRCCVRSEDGTLFWSDLGKTTGLAVITAPEIVFTPLDSERMEAYREQYAGSQKERKEKNTNSDSVSQKAQKEHAKILNDKPAEIDMIALFNEKIALRTAVITKVERHPDAEKLYIETLNDGRSTERIILSGLVPYYKEEDLMGKTVILADNLKPRKMRGIESHGMLLAADYTDKEGNEVVEVLQCPCVAAGTPVLIEGYDSDEYIAHYNQKPESIDADTFFAVQLTVQNHEVCINGKRLLLAGKPIVTSIVCNGSVG